MSRDRVILLARRLDWPRVTLPRQTSGGADDAVGPGAVAWYLFIEQMPAELIEAAGRKLEQRAAGSEPCAIGKEFYEPE